MKHLAKIAFALAVAVAFSATQAADDVYAPPTPAKLKAQTLKWAADQKPSADVQKLVTAIWSDIDASTSPRVGFQKVIETFAVVRPEAKQFIDDLTLVDVPLLAPKADLLKQKGLSKFYVDNMKLYYGRYLAQRKMYEEGLTVLGDVNMKAVADPATGLFFKGVCEHQLLQKKDGLATIAKLLKSTERVPVSYSNVATLMQHELTEMKGGVSLKKVSLKMRNSERKLDLAQGGQRIQKLQGEIIADLDELIEKMENSGGS